MTEDSSKIVSLIASATEMVCLLGARDRLCGRSHECDYPPDVESLPVLTAPRFNPVGSSREIDQRVRDLLQDAMAVYEVDENKLKDLAPKVIVTQSQCDVCAVSLADVEQAVCERLDSNPQIVSFEPRDLPDVWDDILRLGQVLNLQDRAAQEVAQLKERLLALENQCRHDGPKPRVLCLEWIDPPMSGGHWMPELVRMAGGEEVMAGGGLPSRTLTWEEILNSKPEVVIVMPCGFSIEQSRQDMTVLSQNPQWKQLPAVQNGQVYVADGNHYFNRPGPRLVESAEIVAEILWPEKCDYGHKEMAWQQL